MRNLHIFELRDVILPMLEISIAIERRAAVLATQGCPRPSRTIMVLIYIFLTHRKPSFYGHSHDTTAEKLADRPEPISTPLQRILKHIMPVRRIYLSFPEGSDVVVIGSTLRTFQVLIGCLIKTPLVKGVFAKEMDSWQIKTSAAGRAPSDIEDGRFIT